MQLRWSALTHVGKVREINEDTFALEPARGVFAVFDGMGGNVSGEVAAQVSAESLRAYLAASDPRRYGGVMGLLVRLNDAVLRRAEDELWLRGMGATAAALWLREDGVAEVGHVGDCRVYRWREGELDLLTEDHSLLNQMASFQHMPREMVETFQYRNVVTRALGIKAELSAQVRQDTWRVGDVYLICSDGAYDPGGAALFDKVLWRHGADVARVCEEVMAEVLSGAARDNATVVAVAVEPDGAQIP